jgi:hypothetical protein
MRNQILTTLQAQFNAGVIKHQTNIEIILNNPMAIHEHSDLIGALEDEIAKMAEYQDKLEILEKYFK